MAKNEIKPEIRLRHIMGRLQETAKTGEYPDYYMIRSRKYEKSWKVNELPVDLKYKREIVYSIIDELTIHDKEGKIIESVEFGMEMRD